MKPSEMTQQIVKNVRSVIKGKDPQIESILCCWLAGGHVLIEDLPGTGKTILARALAMSVQVDFKRVQFTPDLLPSDILGSSIFNQKDQSFHFAPGPLFTTCLLADEINRATPRTQSALLEAMGERQVSIDGVTRALDPDFLVLGTQNPIEQRGTLSVEDEIRIRYLTFLNIMQILRNPRPEYLPTWEFYAEVRVRHEQIDPSARVMTDVFSRFTYGKEIPSTAGLNEYRAAFLEIEKRTLALVLAYEKAA
jgi:MoxR-like ATPase